MAPRSAIRWMPKDEPLRDDVRTLGALLGEVIREQEGDALFERVGGARRAAVARRAGDPSGGEQLRALTDALDPALAGDLVRAFSAWFGLVNLAERVHRIRRRRAAMQEAGGPGSDVAATVRALATGGVGPDGLGALLEGLQIVPVMTAHPTEATRRTLLRKDQRIARALVGRLDLERLVPREREAALSQVRQEVTAAWQTDEDLSERPVVADEVENILFFLTDVVYRVAPALAESMEAAVREVHGAAAPAVPWPLLRFASWVGGDMDGNPYAGPATIRAALAAHREAVVRCYLDDVDDLFDRLSQSQRRASFDPPLVERLDAWRAEDPTLWDGFPARYATMPYRALLHGVRERLRSTLVDGSRAYAGPAGLLADLRLVAASLRAHGGAHGGLHRVTRLVRRVECFGLHLATLDVREDALVHRAAVGALLGIDGFGELDAARRGTLIEEGLTGARAVDASAPAAARSLDVMRALADGMARFGPDAIGPFIISMAQGPDDVLAVLLLARAAGLVGPDGEVPLDVAPLFETVEDLERGPATLATLLGHPAVRAHLAARGGRQIVMLGYSDSSKGAGIAASRLALWTAQRDLVASAAAAGVRLVLFHGRGGSISRGGSRPREAILAEPAGAVAGVLRVTEQGEIINAKYGLRDIALRTLDQLVSAVLEASAASPPPPDPRWLAAMGTIAAASRSAFRALVHEDPGFWPLFRAVTPIDVIERMTIGSRPASRRTQRGVDDLRAIPWVFAWTQTRVILPGWYGLVDGLEAALAAHGEGVLREMASGWPFFAMLLADVEMVLAKSDMGIGERYLALGGTAGVALGRRLGERFAATEALVCHIQGTAEPLERDPVLRRAILLRNPYVDPMSLLQVDLLARWRAAGSPEGPMLDALRASVRGIARGLQNTG